MYHANLNFSLLEKYLAVAIDSGFIQVEGTKYKLTESGQEFLKSYTNFEKRFNRAQKLVEDLISERERLTQSFIKTVRSQ
jgi:predicted transcriptional regulator